jgi:hypothetical protein
VFGVVDSAVLIVSSDGSLQGVMLPDEFLVGRSRCIGEVCKVDVLVRER